MSSTEGAHVHPLSEGPRRQDEEGLQGITKRKRPEALACGLGAMQELKAQSWPHHISSHVFV